ncbi:MAG: hypothetical protein V3R66_06000 [Rhodospirillales bacterium]
MAAMNIPKITNVERDSLHILPLSMIPLENTSLRRARMVKNVRLESVIELFGGKGTDMGSGQIQVDKVGHEFDLSRNDDLTILKKLAKLPSFDIYSLRIQLREHDIPINDYAELRLSDHKKEELAIYMKEFTRQLILQIYGDDKDVQDYKDLIGLFQHPDIKLARRKLKTISDRLEIRLDQLPAFFEDFGDVFLSMSYYRQCFDHISPIIIDFGKSVDEVCNAYNVKSNKTLGTACHGTKKEVRRLVAVITGQFRKFDISTKRMWEQVNAEQFRTVEAMIQGSYVDIGRKLCGLTVKMDAWVRKFPYPDSGGAMQKAEFIYSDIRENIHAI